MLTMAGQTPHEAPTRVAIYVPLATSDVVHEQILARVRAFEPHLVLLGPEVPLDLDPSWPGETVVFRLGSEDAIPLPRRSSPDASDLLAQLSNSPGVYERPANAPEPRVRFETPHHVELELGDDSVLIRAHALEGTLLDELRLHPGSTQAPRPLWSWLGVGLAALGFLFGALSLVLRRQVL
jgi:hypothetical protein